MNFNTTTLTDHGKLPILIDVNDKCPEDFISFYIENKKEITHILQEKGAIKFKGIQIDHPEDFQKIVNAISDKFLNYIDGNSPRTKLSEHIYTSTEYDKTQKITMHNELSYSNKWPSKLFFTCIQPAETGGETLLVDSREILKAVPQSIVSKIEEKGLIYIRNLHGGSGMGPSWQDTFETQDKETLMRYCKAYHIDFTWKTDNTIQLKQKSKGIIQHPITKEKVWFNQIDQFHPYHLGEEFYELIRVMYETYEDYPMYVTYGDGACIAEPQIEAITSAIDTLTSYPIWNTNELLLVDNVLVAHGRNAFTGARKVLVSMSE